ncbi:hypothetical protein [Staphylococcus delphini]|uniref:hypothetical protein n=1 Tax=Staphylococcus delphini TaxID=53344 RepID=UPI0021CFA21E|nr:hypothetical protein [Staphylococcus delphini]UXS57171.1 hypothetical protein MUA44_10070 [Staphylococcus delphini]
MATLDKSSKVITLLLLFSFVFWILMTLVIQGWVIPPPKNNLSTYEALEYYRQIKGYFGSDHVSKGIIYIVGLLIPLNVFFKLKNDNNNIGNTVALLFGMIYFFVNGVSLIIQGITAEFAIHLIDKENVLGSHAFAVNIFNWVLHYGGISFSTYIVVNICLTIWVMIIGKLVQSKSSVFSLFYNIIKYVLPLFVLISIVMSIMQLESVSMVFSMIDLIALLWIFMITFKRDFVVHVE